MTEMVDLDELAERLGALGEMLVFDDPEPALAAVERVASGDRATSSPWPRRLLVAAAAMLVVAAGVLLIPDARSAVARWFGIDGVDVDVAPDLTLPADAPSTFDLPGPGDSTVVELDGRRILVSAIAARPNEVLISKTVQASHDVVDADVNGHDGLWVGGGAHEVLYETPDGEVEVRRVAANTLLWWDGDVLYRVEGFDDLDDALAFAAEGT